MPNQRGPGRDRESEKEKGQLERAVAVAMKDAEFPDLKAILCQFLKLTGGAEGVARMLRREYKSAKPGSMIRSMILQMILQGTKAISQKEAARDASLISDADIERELASIMGSIPSAGKYASALPGVVDEPG